MLYSISILYGKRNLWSTWNLVWLVSTYFVVSSWAWDFTASTPESNSEATPENPMVATTTPATKHIIQRIIFFTPCRSSQCYYKDRTFSGQPCKILIASSDMLSMKFVTLSITVPVIKYLKSLMFFIVSYSCRNLSMMSF